MDKKTKTEPNLSDLSRVATEVADATTPNAVFAAVAEAADRLIGHRLFTIMAFNADAVQVQRVYSNNPEAYPPGGRKDKRDTPWGRHVLEQGRPFIGVDADDIRANFDDHEVILGLGLESVLNVPVRLYGQTIGTMNLLHERGFYDTTSLNCGYFLAGQLVGPLSVS
ncbi:MAG: GAF domain-containing protein [Pseudomonadota bacterium]